MIETYEPDALTTACESTDTAEIIVQTFDDGTGRIEIAEYATEVENPVDVFAYLTADEMRAIADHLMAAADVLDGVDDE